MTIKTKTTTTNYRGSQSYHGLTEISHLNHSSSMGASTDSMIPLPGKPNVPISPPAYTRLPDNGRAFHLFSNLPTEIRMRIWKVALLPRIVRWIRMSRGTVFTAVSRSLPLLSVCQESRQAAFLYGMYRVLTTTSSKVYFSPVIDYLWLDPRWIYPGLSKSVPQDDPLDSVRSQFEGVRNIMLHPNWTRERKEPTISLATLPSIKTILIAADEKSIGFHSAVMLETVQDIKHYYQAVQEEMPNMQMPYVAVGCLGWTGHERRALWHGAEDNRELIGVFENHEEMKAHLAILREEEWRFTQQRFHQPKIVHNLRRVRKEVEAVEPSTETGSQA